MTAPPSFAEQDDNNNNNNHEHATPVCGSITESQTRNPLGKRYTTHFFSGSYGEGLVRTHGIGHDKAVIAVEDLTTQRAMVTCEVQATRYSASSEKETSFGYPISSVFRHGPLVEMRSLQLVRERNGYSH
jgi:hypothetical protein